MTFAVEEHNGAIWLMIDGIFIAKFTDQTAVLAFWGTYNRALMVAREVGRQGIG